MKTEKEIRETIEWLESINNEDMDYSEGFYVCLDCKMIHKMDNNVEHCIKNKHTLILCEIEACSIPDIINILKWVVKE